MKRVLHKFNLGFLKELSLPLMFLLYINDINCGISSKLRLFTDDCILYCTINGQNDHFHLQADLNLIVKWVETWQMNLNIDKCAILTCSRLLSSLSMASLQLVLLNIHIWELCLILPCHSHPISAVSHVMQ